MAGQQRAVVIGKLIQIDTLEIDVCRDETHTLTNTVTDHPVEQGANISDHSRPDPDQVTLTCFVTNTPLSADQMKLAARQAAQQDILLNPDGSVAIANVPDRGHRVFDALKKLRDQGTLIQVITTLKIYGASSTEGMMITSLTVPRNQKNYDGLEFSITLKAIRIVRNRASRDDNNTDMRQGQAKSKGNQTPKTPEDRQSHLAKRDSASGGQWTNTMVNWLGGSNP